MHLRFQHTISSSVQINASAERVWNEITNVRIEQFADPWYFRLLDIPKPLSAKVTKTGVGGRRIAYFASGKRFVQQILVWNPFQQYTFTFEPDPKFRVGYLFDLHNGQFQLHTGAYTLRETATGIQLDLQTTYSLRPPTRWVLGWPIYWVLLIFQRYLLQSIQQNAES